MLTEFKNGHAYHALAVLGLAGTLVGGVGLTVSLWDDPEAGTFRWTFATGVAFTLATALAVFRRAPGELVVLLGCVAALLAVGDAVHDGGSVYRVLDDPTKVYEVPDVGWAAAYTVGLGLSFLANAWFLAFDRLHPNDELVACQQRIRELQAECDQAKKALLAAQTAAVVASSK